MHIEAKASPCPQCGSDKIIKHSKYKGSQQYKCKTCGRTLLPTTGTLIHHLEKKPDKFGQYASIIEKEGLSIIAEMAKSPDLSMACATAIVRIPEDKHDPEEERD